MKKHLLGATAIYLMSLGISHAAVTGQSLADEYVAAGYTRVEVKVGTTYAEVEAIRDGRKVEVVYDLQTGAIVRSESERADGDDLTETGVSIRNVDDDSFDDDDDGDDDDDDLDDDDDMDDDNDDDDSDDDNDDDDSDDDDDGDDDDGDDDDGDDD